MKRHHLAAIPSLIITSIHTGAHMRGVCTNVHILREQRRRAMRQSVVSTVLMDISYRMTSYFSCSSPTTRAPIIYVKITTGIHPFIRSIREGKGERGGQRDWLTHFPDTLHDCPQRRTTRTVSLLRPRNQMMWICPGSQPVSIKETGTRGTLSAEGTSMNVGGTDNTPAAVFPWKVGQQLNMNDGAGLNKNSQNQRGC